MKEELVIEAVLFDLDETLVDRTSSIARYMRDLYTRHQLPPDNYTTFLQRFVEHVLPAGFVKIRHYGLLAPSHVPAAFAEARTALCAPSSTPADEPTACHDGTEDSASDWAALLLELTGTDLTLCPACGARALLRTPLPAARAPPAEAP